MERLDQNNWKTSRASDGILDARIPGPGGAQGDPVLDMAVAHGAREPFELGHDHHVLQRVRGKDAAEGAGGHALGGRRGGTNLDALLHPQAQRDLGQDDAAQEDGDPPSHLLSEQHGACAQSELLEVHALEPEEAPPGRIHGDPRAG